MITIAKATIREAARRRILWVLLALTVVSVGLTSWGTGALAGLGNGPGRRAGGAGGFRQPVEPHTLGGDHFVGAAPLVIAEQFP